jgi:hypothetical protein
VPSGTFTCGQHTRFWPIENNEFWPSSDTTP